MTLLIALMLLNVLGVANFWSVLGVIILWIAHIYWHTLTGK